MIVDGRAITKDILARVKSEVVALQNEIVIRAIVMQPSAATESYLSIKERQARRAGMFLDIVRIENDATTKDIIDKVLLPGAAAVIVQLPLPEHIDTSAVLDAIPQKFDADVLSAASRAAFTSEEKDALLPPVVAAIAEILEREQLTIARKKAVVIGNGWLVGAPVARWLRRMNASVEVLVKGDADFLKLKEADIVVCGAGSPGIVGKEMLKKGVVLIDAGTSESGGQVVGDADPACAEIASVFTPVPGGVGPIAVACLFRNVLTLAQRARLQGS